MERPVEPSDEWRAKQIRELVRALNAEIIDAKKAGLQIDVNLGSIGTPGWSGFADAVKASRSF